ncbi:MAG: hypothetical protein K2X47_03380 [Bdellovibrionales bacterium]|nr:hypothetical protein [Bdellovibrionales bacterium]
MIRFMFLLILISSHSGHASGVCSFLGGGKEGRATSFIRQIKEVTGKFWMTRELKKFDSVRFYQKKAEFLAGAVAPKIENGSDLLAWMETSSRIGISQWTSLPSTNEDHLLGKARLYGSLRKGLHNLAQDGLSEVELWQLATRLYLATHLDAESLEFLISHGVRTTVEALVRQRIEIALLQGNLSEAIQDLGLDSHTRKAKVQNFLYKIKDKLSLLLTALIDVPLLLQGYVPFLPQISFYNILQRGVNPVTSAFPAWLQVIYNPFQRVWNKVALTAVLLAVFQTIAPHGAQADALASGPTRQYLEQNLGNQQGKSVNAERAIDALGEVAKKMENENKESFEVFTAVLLEDIKAIDQKILELPNGNPIPSALAKKRSQLVALLSETRKDSALSESRLR